MTIPGDYRRGRHVISTLHVHLVFVTKYRRGVLDADMLRCCEDAPAVPTSWVLDTSVLVE